MALSLYEMSVPTYLQGLEGVSGFLEKGRQYFADNGVDPDEFVGAQVYPDMRPFSFQLQHVGFHSLGGVEAILSGVIVPKRHTPIETYAGLQAMIAETMAGLAAVDPGAVNVRAGAEVVLSPPGVEPRVFTAEGFLMSFSLPNFYFHAATAYNLLRAKGVPVGKRDFMGPLRLKQA